MKEDKTKFINKLKNETEDIIIARTGLSSWVSTTTQATMIDEKK